MAVLKAPEDQTEQKNEHTPGDNALLPLLLSLGEPRVGLCSKLQQERILPLVEHYDVVREHCSFDKFLWVGLSLVTDTRGGRGRDRGRGGREERTLIVNLLYGNKLGMRLKKCSS